MTKKRRSVSRDRMDRWPAERIERYQLRQLTMLLRYAQRELPFYRERFATARFDPREIRTLADFARVPSFTKKEALAALKEKEAFPAGLEKLERSGSGALCMTSGTLGTSFLYLPENWASLRGDSLARAYRWAGLRRGMRMLMAAPAWHSLAVQETRVLQRIGATCVIPWGTFLPHYAPHFLDAIMDVKPAFISIFLPMLYALLAACRGKSIAPARAFEGVKSILVVGAPMTPLSRVKLKEELGVSDIFEGLGNPEGLTAMECAFHVGHHIFLDCCYVEIIDPRTGQLLPAGQRGNVVVTSLIPHGSVYIRYDTEDLGTILPDRCGCGRTWPLMEVYDRRANVLHIKGQQIVPYDVRLCLDEVPELVNIPFAVIRSDAGMERLTLLIQKPPSGNLNLKEIETKVSSLLRHRFDLEAKQEWAEELPQRWKGITVIEENEWRAARV
jgi:phenylacetate-CoA ligase